MNETRVIALAGNPNVGKSTVFNALTGLRQHTGNWPGKTLAAARGECRAEGEGMTLIDVPGAYSLWAQSAEEEVALEVVCFGGADAVIVVCDGACLERNLNLVYQILDITPRVVVAVNLMDEARKKGVRVDVAALSRHLGVPVLGCCARKGKGVRELLTAARQVMDHPPTPRRAVYPRETEETAAELARALSASLAGVVDPRFAALRLLEGDRCFRRELTARVCLTEADEVAVRRAREKLHQTPERFSTAMVESVYRAVEDACRAAVSQSGLVTPRQERIDRLLTGRLTGLPVMALLLCLIFFVTLKGANWPSAWLGEGFEALEGWLLKGLERLNAPPWLRGLLLDGVYRTLTQVVAVMLPPMAIFFPLFTLLEDSGYLPRVAFTLDRFFEKSHACGKQALTMCMGFGCNAVGVMGCRIIDSPRERLIAILTNAFVPCNGRFPTLIAMMGLFFAGAGGALVSVGLLVAFVLLAVGITLLVSFLLSVTVLRGVPSSYTLELPPYRAPQAGKVILRSILDRTLFVLGRAVMVAAPAGLIIFLLSHIPAAGQPLLTHVTRFLDPLGRLMGLDGVILAGFLLGFPANEIVLPLILMAYTSGEGIRELSDFSHFASVLTQHGWTALTAFNLALFSLFHFPCSTTALTIYQETKSGKWTALALLLPTLVGMALCILTTFIVNIL